MPDEKDAPIFSDLEDDGPPSWWLPVFVMAAVMAFLIWGFPLMLRNVIEVLNHTMVCR